MADTKPSPLAPYEFHGLSFSSRGNGEAQATCPFCGHDDSKTGEGHFFVNKKTGQFQCKHCGKEGNTYTFLSLYHKQLLSETKKDDWQALSEIRGRLPWQKFREFRLARDPVGDRWLLPIQNGSGHLANILACQLNPDDSTPIGKAYGTTGCALHLIGEIKATGPIYVVEGPWKVIALTWLFDQCKKDPGAYSVVGIPGANTFKKDWIEKFRGRDVIFLLDNDSAGGDGTIKASKYLQGVALSQKAIQWPSTLPEGYDVRDFICERLKDPRRAWTELQKLIQPFTAPGAKGTKKKEKRIVRKSFFSVLGDFRHSRIFKTSKTFEDALVLTLAAVYAAQIIGKNPLWLFLVGPPSAGKTLLIHCFLHAQDRCKFLSQLTRSALVTGWRTPDGEDPSLLPKLKGKCLFIEDYTTVKSLPGGAQDELYGLLRAAYQGKYDHTFGNATDRNYEGNFFSMVAGVTNIIYRNSHALEGERFLKIRMGDDMDRSEMVRQVLINQNRIPIEKIAAEEERLRDSISAFLDDHPFDPSKDLCPIPLWFINRMVGLSQVAAILRTVVERKGDELLYRPEEEFGFRLSILLSKYAQMIAFVLGKSKIDREVYRLVQRLALDTVVGFNLEVVHVLFKHPAGCILDDIGSALQLSHTTVSNRLRDLQELRAVYQEVGVIRKSLKGKPRDVWHLSHELREMWKLAEITYTPPIHNPHKVRPGFKRKTKKKAHLPRTKKRAKI